MTHLFILKPGCWQGKGTINLNTVEEDLNFLTKWNVTNQDFTGKIQSMQEIQIDGISDQMKNEMTFFDFTSKSFSIEMENLNLGRIVGTGIYNEKIIAWEFRNNDLNFEGLETYYLQSDGTYKVHAEYVTSDQFRTLIKAVIWLDTSTPEKKDTP